MFKFLKEKLGNAFSAFGKKIGEVVANKDSSQEKNNKENIDISQSPDLEQEQFEQHVDSQTSDKYISVDETADLAKKSHLKESRSEYSGAHELVTEIEQKKDVKQESIEERTSEKQESKQSIHEPIDEPIQKPIIQAEQIQAKKIEEKVACEKIVSQQHSNHVQHQKSSQQTSQKQHSSKVEHQEKHSQQHSQQHSSIPTNKSNETLSLNEPIQLKEKVAVPNNTIITTKNNTKTDSFSTKSLHDKETTKSIVENVVENVVEKKPSFFERITQAITTKKISQEEFEELFFDFEMALLENNVAVQVIDKIKVDLASVLVDKPIKRGDVEKTLSQTLSHTVHEILHVESFAIEQRIRAENKPFIITFVGVNGSGKTTQLAKIASRLQKQGFSCVMAACDTFRAAAIQQLEEHATNLQIKLIKHDYGSDAAAVAYDAVAYAKSHNIDVVLIDTAGRLHSNTNLMNELQKLHRVVKPQLTIFVGESITGNDCVEQALQFGEHVRIDGIILTKADVDDKGGAALSISYVTKKPILFLGTGQKYDDLVLFDPSLIADSLSNA